MRLNPTSRPRSAALTASGLGDGTGAASPIVIKSLGAVLACLALTACGGAGGLPGPTSNAPIPPPVPPPPPPPPPPPQPMVPRASFDTQEFRRSDGPLFHGADAAWSRNATGAGAIIAVIDSGIDPDNPEFAGRIHPDSRDVAGNRSIDAENDHGTNIALIAAAARNDSGIVGTAFEAQILALRADAPGSCGPDSPQNVALECVFADDDIARGVDQAIASGASVINLSLGGSGASPVLRRALSRAADAGIVVVISAGNAGDGSDPEIDPAQPDPFAIDAVNAGNGNVIIVGSVDEVGEFSTFSNRAGAFAASFLTARGERLCCVYDDGEVFVETIGGDQFVTLFSGTSFSTPQVAGAVALLAQAFPNLTATQIVEILLETARDAGAAGLDPVFGAGVLDIAAAFAPLGTTRLAGSDAALGLGSDYAIGSAAMGDALRAASLSAVVLDRFDRAYNVSLDAAVSRDAPQVPRLRAATAQGAFTRSAAGPGFALAVSVGEGARAAGLGWSSALQLTPDEAHGARVLAARVAARIAPDMQIGFAIAQGSEGLVGQLQGATRAAFLIAPGASADRGFIATSDVALALRRELGAWGVTVAAERGRVWLGGPRFVEGALLTHDEQHPAASVSVALDRRWNGLETGFALTWLAERDTLLGGRFAQALGIAGADTALLDARAVHRLGEGWQAGIELRAGLTRPRGGGLVAEGSQLFSEAWSLDFTRTGIVGARDTLGLRISQPLRVSGGSLRFDLPVEYDYASSSAVFARQSLDLTPEGREIMSELNWGLPLWGGWASASAFHRSQPGHFEQAPDDVGALVRFNAAF